MRYIENGIEIDLDQKDVDKLIENLLSEAEKPVQEIVKTDNEMLKDAARKFLSVLEFEEQRVKILQDVLNEKKKWEQEFNKTSNLSGDDLSKARRNTIEYQNYNTRVKNLKKDIQMQKSITNIYKAGMAFQDIMNKAIGQNPILVLVSNTTKGSAAFEVPLRDAFAKKILNIDISSDGKITMRFKAPLGTLNKYAKDVDNEINKIENTRGTDDTQYLDKAYREVLRRFNKYKIKNAKSKYVSVVLWKKMNQWKKMMPSSRGDIAEAYADYYLSDINSLMTGDLENDIDLFMTYIEKVDNARGRLIGDVVKKNADGTTTEYAIKSAGASVETFEQMKEMALSILTTTGNVREVLMELKYIDQRDAVKRNKIEDLLSNDIIKVASQEISGMDIMKDKNFVVQ